MCQRCSGRTAEKDGDDGKDAAAGSSGKREQMGEGDSTKVEAAKRRRQDRNEERGKISGVHFAKWISVEYREEVHEKYKKESAVSSLELSTD